MSSDRADEYLTVAEVAELLKLNQQTVRNWIDQGSLAAVRVGPRRVRVLRSELDRFIAAGATKRLDPLPGHEVIPGDVRDQTREALRSARVAVEGGRRGDLMVAVAALITATERLLDSVEKVLPAGIGGGHGCVAPEVETDTASYFDERR